MVPPRSLISPAHARALTRRALLRRLAGGGLATLGGVTAVRRATAEAAPATPEVAAAESPSAAAEVLWDTWGVPHIFAGDAPGLFFGFGWAQAHAHGDLLLQLYAQARGRSAEFYGEDSLAIDRIVRTMGLHRPGRDVVRRSRPPDFRANLDAFAAGINAYAAKHPDRLAQPGEAVLPVTGDRRAGPRGADLLPVPRRRERGPRRSCWATRSAAPTAGRSRRPAPRTATRCCWPTPTSRGAGSTPCSRRSSRRPGSTTPTARRSSASPSWRSPSTTTWAGPTRSTPSTAATSTPDPRRRRLPVRRRGPALRDRGPRRSRSGRTTARCARRRWRCAARSTARSSSTTARAPRDPDGGRRRLVVGRRGAGAMVGHGPGDEPGGVRGRAAAPAAPDLHRHLRRPRWPRPEPVQRPGAGPARRGEFDWSEPVPGDTSATLWTEIHPYDDLPRVVDPPSGWVQNSNSPPWYTTYPLHARPGCTTRRTWRRGVLPCGSSGASGCWRSTRRCRWSRWSS